MSLKTKIFFLVTLVVIVSFLMLTRVVSGKTVELAEADAFALAQEMADKYKNEIKAELQGSRVTAETLATVFETLKRRGITDRDMMNDILKSALAKKDYITAFCVAYDPDALDGQDEKYAGQKPAYDETGRYSPYWNKLGGNIEVQPLYDIDIADWYIVPKATKQEYITDPYPYFVQGQPVMLASLVFPIVYKEQAIGIVASDIVLDKLQEMVSRVNPRSQGGFTEVLSNSGIIVAHPEAPYLGKDLMESILFHKLWIKPSLIPRAVRPLEKLLSDQPPGETDGDADRRERLDRLVRNLKAYAADQAKTALDISLFTPELAGKMLEEIDETRNYVTSVKQAIKTGETYIASDEDFYTVFLPIQFSGVTKPWSVVVSIPVKEVQKNADDIRHYAAAVSAIAVFVIATILYFIARSVTWPILDLARSAKRIGEGDFSARIPDVGGGDEIDTLANALRFMVGRNGELIAKMQEYAGELEEKNKYLNRLNELKDEFLANTSHELRTPIHGIIGIAESMIDGAAGPLSREQKYNLAVITNSGKRLSNMINDILDFTRLKNKELNLQLKPVDLKTLVDTVLVLSKPLAKGKALDLENGIDADFPLVAADENRMQQILYNLVGNAVKFTEKGHIRVSAGLRDDMAAISVHDTGIGISEDKLVRIFESFEQSDGSIEREYGGTGLGLSITRKLVELHGGTIEVASTLGAGSIFTFTVPLSDAKKEPAASAAGRSAVVDMDDYLDDGEGEREDAGTRDGGERVLHRILAVDDEPVNLQVLKNFLKLRNCSISTAYSGVEALKMIEEGKEGFDLVLLDVMMPKMSGYEVCRRLRLRYSLFELPILMLTAKNQLQDIVLGFRSGANDYLPKPFDKAELLARVRTLLSLKRAVTSAIHNEKMFESEKQKRILEQTLLEVTSAITSTLDLKEVLAKVLEAMSHFIRIGRSVVILKEGERFEVAVSGGPSAEVFPEGMEIDVAGDGFLAEMAATGRPIIGSTLSSRFLEWRCPGDTLTGVPILYRDALLGFIVLCCGCGTVSRELLFTLAGQAGVAIQNARMFTEINQMAKTDGLTGLYNRRYFFELAEKEFAKFKRYGTALSVCMMDIDRFKSINDTHGHAVGDEVLRHLAGKLNMLLREYDIVGRYGGEEFAVVFPETPLESAARIVERIRSEVESSPVPTSEFGELRYTLSLGVAACSKDSRDIMDALEEADKGLYEAKETGRNKVVVRTPS